mmetsp:Transcript_17409/g.50844  ORF Transcript_17409/g.50844 Transcript_17409/m.50844 type:complete len:309 (-) Transcript_17409:51-977(-)
MRQDRRRRESTASPFVLLLLGQLYQQVERLPVKPPVTLGLIMLNVICHVQPSAVPLLDIPLREICLQPSAILSSLSVSSVAPALVRLLGSAFIHGDDYHLYYNMASFLWKGSHLEHTLGSGPFFTLVFVLLVLSHSLAVLLGALLPPMPFLGDPMHSCAVGFSGVIFALKYFMYVQEVGITSIHGIFIAYRHAAWLELVLISLVNPQASFLGHLCGILAGAVVYHTRLFPYKAMWRAIEALLNGVIRWHDISPAFTASSSSSAGAGGNYYPTGGRTRRYTPASGTTGGGGGAPGGGQRRQWGFESQLD